jgi:hypothetical protein
MEPRPTASLFFVRVVHAALRTDCINALSGLDKGTRQQVRISIIRPCLQENTLLIEAPNSLEPVRPAQMRSRVPGSFPYPSHRATQQRACSPGRFYHMRGWNAGRLGKKSCVPFPASQSGRLGFAAHFVRAISLDGKWSRWAHAHSRRRSQSEITSHKAGAGGLHSKPI